MKYFERNIETGEYYKILASFIVISLIIISSIFLIRQNYFEDVPTGYKTYYNMLLSERSPGNFFSRVSQDPQSIEKKIIFQETGHIILDELSKIVPAEYSTTSQFIFLYIISLINMILFVMLIKKFTRDLMTIFATGLFFITSPQFVYLPAILSPIVITNLLILVLAHILLKYESSQKKITRIILGMVAVVISVLLSVTNVVYFIAIMFIGAGFFFVMNKTVKRKGIYFAISSASIITFFCVNYNLFVTDSIGLFFSNYNIFPSQIFSEMGVFQGIRIVDLFLSIIGIGLIWNKKRKYYITSLIAVLIILASFKIYDFNSIMFPVLAILSGISYSMLARMKWDLEYIKKICMIIIVIFTLVSCVQYIILLGFSEPYPDKYVTFSYMSRQGTSKDVVLSSIENGYLIEEISKKRAVLDSNMNGIENVQRKIIEYNSVFNSRSLDYVRRYFLKKNITYVVIDKTMKENLWNSKVDGLYFVMKNSDSFRKIYTKNDLEIYQFQPRPLPNNIPHNSSATA